ncbi:hypothetical protein ASG51_15130 [Methylobacterium sp. Leaf465]|nr:hypothetical protein ASG51_15130 [Methylobacterium sp. Leaf465]
MTDVPRGDGRMVRAEEETPRVPVRSRPRRLLGMMASIAAVIARVDRGLDARAPSSRQVRA